MSDSTQPVPRPTGVPPPPPMAAADADRILGFGQAAAPPADTPPAPGELQVEFPHFEIITLLGRGGMGAVYKARQKALDRLVALKVLRPDFCGDAQFAARFAREARAMAKLNHPNIVTVFDSGRTEQGRLYFVMEYVDGTNLAQLISSGSLDEPQALAITAQVCEALGYSHGEGVVHRDIKPANVMLNWQQRVKVTDFGLARLIALDIDPTGLTTTGTVMGTPDYMAPEQRSGKHVDHRADIFSVGVMLYEMLCREVPRGVFSPPSSRAGCDRRIDEIVSRAMQGDPGERYQSTQELRTAVETVRASSGYHPPQGTKAKPRRGLAALAVAAVLLAIGLAVPGVWRGSHTQDEILPATPPPLAGRWLDWLAAQTQNGMLPEGLARTPDGWLAQVPSAKQEVYLICGPVAKDQALRVTYLCADDGSDAGLQVILRSSMDFKSLYRVHASEKDWGIFRRDPDGDIVELASVPRTPAMRKPGERTVEFRAIGDTLTFIHDGAQVATIRDSSLREGRPRVSCRDGIVFKKIEWFDPATAEK